MINKLNTTPIMKRTILLAAIAAWGFNPTWADDYPYLMFQTADGNTIAVTASELTITFADGKLIATNAEGTQTITLTDLSKMYFSTTGDANAIEDVKADGPTDMSQEPVEVFTLTGISIGKYDTLQQAKSSLSQGIYVVKSASRTLKIAVK